MPLSPSCRLQPDRMLFKISILSLADGQEHRLTETPVITVDRGSFQDNVTFSVQICGSYVGILFITPNRGEFSRELLVWNWMKGTCHLVGA
jgi:hypothetical protein